VTDVELELPETPDADDVEIPGTLPVLPLKETVVFPDSATPLAIGQERSIQLIDDVVARDGKLALVTVRSPGGTTSTTSAPPRSSTS
jgi:Lon protease-like protein